MEIGMEGIRFALNVAVVALVALVTVVVLVIAVSVAKCHITINNLRKQGMPVVDNMHWLFGHLKVHPGPTIEGLKWMLSLAEKFQSAFLISIGPTPIVVASDPVSIRAILSTAQPKIHEGHGYYSLLKPWLGEGLLTSGGDKWFKHRKLLTPAFHYSVLKPYVKIYNNVSEILINKLERAFTKVSDNEEDPDTSASLRVDPKLETSSRKGSVEILDPVSLATVDIMLQCAFTYDNAIQESGDKYLNIIRSLTNLFMANTFSLVSNLPLLNKFTPLYRKFVSKCHDAHIHSEILLENRRESLLEDPDQERRKYKDFLDILFSARDEKGQGLTLLDIRDEVDTILFAGHDTTSSAISWILHTFAKHPKHQRKCQGEIDGLLEGRDSDEITWEDLSRMPYLTQCIKEGLRLTSPVPFITRTLESPLNMNGVILPEGVMVCASIYGVHHLQSVWGKDVEEFRPERFSDEESSKRMPYSFVPFSSGPRNCIGKNFAMNELKTVIARILRRFDLEEDKAHTSVPYPSMVMSAKNGIRVVLQSRAKPDALDSVREYLI